MSLTARSEMPARSASSACVKPRAVRRARNFPATPPPSNIAQSMLSREFASWPTRWATRWASRHGSFVDGRSEWVHRINKVQWRCRDDVHGIQQEIGEALLRRGSQRRRPRSSRPDRTPRLRRAQSVSRSAQRHRRPEGASWCHRDVVQTGLHCPRTDRGRRHRHRLLDQHRDAPGRVHGHSALWTQGDRLRDRRAPPARRQDGRALARHRRTAVAAAAWSRSHAAGRSVLMQQSARNRKTILRFFNEVMALGSLGVLDELAVDDYEDHVALAGQDPGRAGLKQRVATIRAAFEPRQELHDVIVDGDRVAVRWTLRGTHTGPFIGMPATGRPVEFDGVDLYAMREGRMAAHWNVVGLWAFYQQVGGAVMRQHGPADPSD